VATAGADGTIALLVNQGNGFLASPQRLTAGNSLGGLTTGDFNMDLDLVVTTQTNQALVLTNDGQGVFSAPMVTTTGNRPLAVLVGNVNGDGQLDGMVSR